MHRKRWVMNVRVLAVLIGVVLTAVGCGNSATPPSNKGNGSPTATPDPAALVSLSQLKKVPDLQSMPNGWKTGRLHLSGRDVGKDCPRSSNVCAGMTSSATAQYDNADSTGNVYLELAAYQDRDTARAGYTSRSASFASKDDRQISMPAVGNASVARTGFSISGHPVTSMVMRVGTVVVALAYTHEDKADSQVLLSVARTQAERIQQAQRGETPIASLAG
ncbi:hypothetical protein [Streptomyces sp. NPDC050485]|uniref:hypothetical protein n=1 Tax=Streptomyces sp. NPDC050485 TaxID=3365617 RepID=UPI00379B42D5